MDEPCSRDALRGCLADLARLNRWFRGYRPVLAWLNSIVFARAGRPIHILDVGCGYGDGLRRVEQWATELGVPVVLTGLDLNPDAIAIAQEATPPASGIRWVASDVFAYSPKEPLDVVVSSLFTHHLSEADIVRFIGWMENQAALGWFINDLSRAAVPYYFLQLFTRMAGMHPFVQNDASVSIARAFIPEDWQRICTLAGLRAGDVAIQPFVPARLCVARRKR